MSRIKSRYQILTARYEGAGTKQFDLTGQKPGLYILVVTAGTAIRTEVSQVIRIYSYYRQMESLGAKMHPGFFYM
ncbi:hypothetical protein [Ohtaekwangia koreensis]|nr:hypothetical protein [Ohtaekwangia koreensis]